METLIETWKNTGTLHHAYCVVGERAATFASLVQFLQSLMDFPVQGNPDFWHEEFETFGIDDGRRVKELHSVRPLGERRVSVIKANFITREAQNSLLKILEEPGEGMHFFILVPDEGILLPTLRSRLLLVKFSGDAPKGRTQAREFVAATVGRRLEMIKELMGEIDDEEKTRQDVISLVGAVEDEVYKRAKSKGTHMSASDARVLEEIEKCRDYLGDRSPSTKMILEHLAVFI